MQLRETNLQKLDAKVFDVAVIGGGINGAVSAAALASQGASVALIDRGDFASETSQHSSNLAWGGIKYLESYEFGLVRKLCTSRNHLIRSYPSTVREIRFFGTIARGFRRSRIMIFLGSVLYWFMGNFFTRPPRLLSRKDVEREAPQLKTEMLAGGLEYSDAYLHDNDARFVFQFVRSALDHGAVCANYVECLGSKKVTEADGGTLWVTEAQDLEDGHAITIRSKVLINACGPWADEYTARSGAKTQHRHLFSKGVHLLIDRLFENDRVHAFFADDGRLFFVIPMGPKTVIGTTDTRVEELPAVVTDEDRTFILDNINKRVNLSKPLTKEDIIAERCGVRPLVVEQRSGDRRSSDWTQLSRKHIIEVDRDDKRVTIFGGKLTDCINVGNEIAQDVTSLGLDLPYRGRRWYGEPPREIRDEFFHQALLMKLDDMTADESSEPLSTRLWRRYATSALAMLEKIRQDPAQAEVLIKGTELIRAEVEHAARCEMITELEDFLRRRTQIALIERKEIIRNAPGLREACQILFGDKADEKLATYFAGATPALASRNSEARNGAAAEERPTPTFASASS